MTIRPLHDRVIVKRLDEEEKTASGIVIADTAAQKPAQGEIMSVGEHILGIVEIWWCASHGRTRLP